ncbi:thioredoxin family protein [Zhouia sp. PK063]|uniref:thioredoxin family protein n=1 Tax=Zhouia sp. PK063 TaxID=3373602 RepID=UPI0037A406D6
MKQVQMNFYRIGVCLILVSLLSSCKIMAQQHTPNDSGIIFNHQEFKKVLAVAKAHHKKIFVDAYATWCAPCKQLQKTTFKDAKASAYYNRNFINISVDVERGEGLDLAKTWKIEGLPTLLILNEDGEVLASHTGYVDGNGLLEFTYEVSTK